MAHLLLTLLFDIRDRYLVKVGRAVLIFLTSVMTLDTVSFILLDVLPSAAIVHLGLFAADPELLAQANHQLGLDGPWYIRLMGYWWRVLGGDLGRSLAGGYSVRTAMIQRLGASIPVWLSSFGVLVSVFFLAMFVSPRSERKPTYLGELTRFGAHLIGAVAQFVSAVLLSILGRYGGVELGGQGVDSLILATLGCVSLPAAALFLVASGRFSQLMQAGFVDIYRSRGMSWIAIRWRLGRNVVLALRPFMSRLVLWTVTGSIVVEVIFDRGGYGQLLFEAFKNNDVPIVRAWMLFTGAFVLLLAQGEQDAESKRIRAYPGTKSRYLQPVQRRYLLYAATAILLSLWLCGSWIYPTEFNYLSPLQEPSWRAPFGTSPYGQALFVTSVRAASEASKQACVAVAGTLGLAVVVGGLAGRWSGRYFDSGQHFIARVLDSLGYIVPTAAISSLNGSITSGALALFLPWLAWPNLAQLIRAEYIASSSRPDVETASVLGVSRWRLLKGYFLPSAIRTLAAPLAALYTSFLAVFGTLEYFGLGIKTESASLGFIIFDGSQNYLSAAPWYLGAGLLGFALAVAPAILIAYDEDRRKT